MFENWPIEDNDWCIENDAAAQNGETPHVMTYVSEDDKLKAIFNEINSLRHEVRALYFALKNGGQAENVTT